MRQPFFDLFYLITYVMWTSIRQFFRDSKLGSKQTFLSWFIRLSTMKNDLMIRCFFIVALIILVTDLSGQCVITITCRPTPPKVECACEIEEISPEFIGIEAIGDEDIVAFEELGFSVDTTGNCGAISVTANEIPHHPEDCQDSFYVERVYSLRSEFSGNRPTCRDTFFTEFIPVHFLEEAKDVQISCQENVDSLFQVFIDSLSFARFLDCNNEVESFYFPDQEPVLNPEDCNGMIACGAVKSARPILTLTGPCHLKCQSFGGEDVDRSISAFCVVDTAKSKLICPRSNNNLELTDDSLLSKIDSILAGFELNFGCMSPTISHNFDISNIDFLCCSPQTLDISITAIEDCMTNNDQCTFSITIDSEQQGILAYKDEDGDGYGDLAMEKLLCELIAGYVETPGDCDDTNAMIFPGATEILDNDVDEDCDGADLSAVHDLGEIQVSIFPNPISDLINISVNENLAYEIILFDIGGNVLFSAKNAASIIVGDYSSGVYLLQITDLNSGTSIMERIIKN